MIIKLTQVPPESVCWDYKMHICPYFYNDGGHKRCRLFDDTLGVDSKQQESYIGVIGVCYWQKEVVV
jgi:hypothetical protein